MSYTPTEEDYEWASRFGHSFARKLSVDGLKDDAAQEACIAVWWAGNTYDPERGVPFRKYVIKRIVGRIKDLLRSEIGRNGQRLPLRNALHIVEDLAHVVPEDRHRCLVVPDKSRPVLDRLIEQEKVQLLYDACLIEAERRQLDSWSGLLTQRSIARCNGISEAWVSLQARRLRAELRTVFEVEELV